MFFDPRRDGARAGNEREMTVSFSARGIRGHRYVPAGNDVLLFAHGIRGRADEKPEHGEIPRVSIRLAEDDGPERRDNLARSVFVQPKHARTSPRPPAEIQARTRKGG